MNNCKIIWNKCSYLKKLVPQEDITEGLWWPAPGMELEYRWLGMISPKMQGRKITALIDIGHTSSTEDAGIRTYPKIRDARGRIRRDWEHPVKSTVRRVPSYFHGETLGSYKRFYFDDGNLIKTNTNPHELFDIFLHITAEFDKVFPHKK